MPEPQRKARIFISHSAKETRAQEVQAALYTALEDSAALVPLMDKRDLEPGDMWRARINLWVGGCDAAVVLLSPKALQSDWVFYEAALLSYRNERDSGFLVLPVYVDVTPEEVAASRLHPTAMTSIQLVPGAGRTVEAIVEDVVKELAKAACRGDSPMERRAKRLADLLQQVQEKQLRAAAAFIKFDLKRWLPEDDARLLLAIQLQSVGMKLAVPALLKLGGSLPVGTSAQARIDWLQQVVELVASSWVDEKAIACIAPIAKGEAKPFSLGLNAVSPVTATMYVLSSCGDEPEPWRLVSCNGVVGQDTVEETIASLRTEVAETLIKTLPLECTPAEVAGQLAKRSAYYPRPVFVSLPGAGISAEILAALRASFPHVVFFLLWGDAVAAGPLVVGEMLENLLPDLVHGDEEIFLDTFENFHANVCIP